MTRKEARRILNMTPQELRLNDVSVEDEEQARQMAIDAFLEEKPHGEWEKKSICYDYFYCSECGYAYKHAFNFCPNCGALMRSSNSEIEKSKSEEANDRPCEKCKHKVETKPGVEACDVWDCSFEPKDEQS